VQSLLATAATAAAAASRAKPVVIASEAAGEMGEEEPEE
jgi:hypothetical protein